MREVPLKKPKRKKIVAYAVVTGDCEILGLWTQFRVAHIDRLRYGDRRAAAIRIIKLVEAR